MTAEAPTWFLRCFEIPAGAPWRQWQAARIEATHAGPLPSAASLVSVRRLGRWAPGVTARFAVAYVRRDERPVPPIETVVDGHSVRFAFASAAAARTDLRDLAVTGLYVATAVLCVGLAMEKALAARAANDLLLTREEVRARRWGVAEHRANAAAKDEDLLRRAGADGRSFADVASDLVWLGRTKRPSAIIERVRWNGPAMRVLVDGSAPPTTSDERALAPIGKIADAREWEVKRSSPSVVKIGLTPPRPPTHPARVAPTRPHVVP